MGAKLRCNAGAAIRYCDFDVAVHQTGSHMQMPLSCRFAGHRIHGVKEEVQEHLLHVHSIGSNRGQRDLEFRAQVDPPAPRVLQQEPNDVVDRAVQIQGLQLELALAQQGPHVANDLAGAQIVTADVDQDLPHFIELGRIAVQQLRRVRIAQNGAQRLIDRERFRLRAHPPWPGAPHASARPADD